MCRVRLKHGTGKRERTHGWWQLFDSRNLSTSPNIPPHILSAPSPHSTSCLTWWGCYTLPIKEVKAAAARCVDITVVLHDVTSTECHSVSLLFAHPSRSSDDTSRQGAGGKPARPACRVTQRALQSNRRGGVDDDDDTLGRLLLYAYIRPCRFDGRYGTIVWQFVKNWGVYLHPLPCHRKTSRTSRLDIVGIEQMIQ